ncbi:carbohydrate ABC transporter permease [Mesorhizobium sp. LjRoot246]|uniref:carbohydrate ABC transporter permease n=1 Tax=Mesorhizobium sp. LjRoot246 TaxID=3342294 RepID=UPI003ECD83D2
MVENARSLNIAATIILALGMLYIVGPLVLMLITATQSYEYVLSHGLAYLPGDQFLENFRSVLTETAIPRQLWNSTVVALSVATGKCILSFAAAFVLVFFEVRHRSLLFALILLTIMLPVEVRVITTYGVASNILSPVNTLLDITGLNGLITKVWGAPIHFQLSVLNTYFGLAAPLIAQGTGVFLFRQFFRTLPADLVKAAKMDGAGPLRFMIDILLPLSLTPFASLFVLEFLSGWTQYLWPLVASSKADMQTAVVGLAHLVPDDDSFIPNFPMIMAGAALVAAIPLTVIALLQRYMVRGLILSEK